MLTVLSFIFAVIPALFLVRYYYRKDAQKPEPKKLVIKIFFIGIASVIPAIILEILVGLVQPLFDTIPLLGSFFKAFIAAALVEEWIKLQVVKRFAYQKAAFDEVTDGIVYAVVASLGFACLENIMYVLDGGIKVALLRAVTSIPLHAFAAGTMGYYIGLAKFADPKQEKSLMRKGLFIAVAIHGLYDFFIFAMPVLSPLSGLLVFPLLIWSYRNLKKKIDLALSDDRLHGRA
jgi:RsiW-degrading membrane proteinase PrsW (M82 family)